MSKHAGFDAELLIVATEVTEITDVDVSLTRDEIEVSDRGNVGWKTFIAGLAEMTVDFTMINDRPNANIDAIEAAFFAATNVNDVTIRDKDGFGFNADFAVLEFSRGEPLQDAVTLSVTFKAATVPTLVTPP